MTYQEALEWLRGNRSNMNDMLSAEGDQPRVVTLMQVAQADAASTQQAYYIVRAHGMGIVFDVYAEDPAVGLIAEGMVESMRPNDE